MHWCALLKLLHHLTESMIRVAIGTKRSQPTENQLLGILPSGEQDHLRPLMQTVRLKYKQAIYDEGSSIGVVYFPVTAVFSYISVLADGSSTEVGLIGNEGMAGLPAFLGAGWTSFNMLIQVAGIAHRMPVSTLVAETHGPGALRGVLLRYTQGFLTQIAQGTACGRHHTVRQRLAMWLLMVGDRVQADRFPMTHEFLGQMLGIGRPSISLAAAALQAEGLISYNRGAIVILDRPGLEQVTCSCYRLICDEYLRLLP